MAIKITIELPDWVSKHETLTLLSGQELVAFKTPREKWKIKTIRCDKCGICCFDMPPDHTPFGIDDEGKCKKLIKQENGEWHCTAKHMKPFSCLSDPGNIEDLGCSIRYK